MTNQALPGRPPAHDLSAFDLSKRSPEQVARSFARWKAQRKRQAEAGPMRADPPPGPKAAVVETGEAAPEETKRTAKPATALQYSAPFSDLLAAGSERTVQRTDLAPVAALLPPQRTDSPGRRLKVMSILAGVASVFALAGGALLELADWSGPAEVAPQVTHIRPKETPMALAAMATSLPAVEWTLQHTVDMALMKVAADAVRPAPEPPTPAPQTASKSVPAAGDKLVLPARKSVPPKAKQFVAKPFVPNAAPAPAPAVQKAAPIPVAPVAAANHAGDPRPDDLFQHGRDDRTGAASDRTVSNRSVSGAEPTAATGTGSAVDARSASARTGSNGGGVDPRGESSGGARVGIDGEGGASTPSDAGSGDVDGDENGTGDAGGVSGDGGASGGSSGGSGSSAGAAGGGDAGAAAAGDSSAGGDTDGDSAGSGDASGGDTGTGDAGAEDSGDGESGEDGESSGIGGTIGGALGAVGDALDGALGGGKGNPDSKDKDQRR